MKLPISLRLLACAQLISPGSRVADVGTDHGYLPIYLRLQGLAAEVYAADIAQGPLDCAKANVKKYGITQGISFYLCDGVRGLPRTFDTLVLAGMGADTMISILEGGPWLKNPRYRLVLQCQSAQNRLRHYLWTQGWCITREEPVQDGRFIYTVMEVQRGLQSLTPGQEFLSPALLQSENPQKWDYMSFCLTTVQKVVQGVEGQDSDRAAYYRQALRELLVLCASSSV